MAVLRQYVGGQWVSVIVGQRGAHGWAPMLAVVVDGDRRVHRVVDWVGGEGAKPATGDYVGPTGLVPLIGSATDIRGAVGATGGVGATGPTGATGPDGETGWAPVLAVEDDGTDDPADPLAQATEVDVGYTRYATNAEAAAQTEAQAALRPSNIPSFLAKASVAEAFAGNATDRFMTARMAMLARACPNWIDMRPPGMAVNLSSGGSGSVSQTNYCNLILTTGTTAQTCVRAWNERGWYHDLGANAGIANFDKRFVIGIIYPAGSSVETECVAQSYLGRPRGGDFTLPAVGAGGNLPAITFKAIGFRKRAHLHYGIVHNGTVETEVFLGVTGSGSGGTTVAFVMEAKAGFVSWYRMDGTLLATTDQGPTGDTSAAGAVVFSHEVTNGTVAASRSYGVSSLIIHNEP